MGKRTLKINWIFPRGYVVDPWEMLIYAGLPTADFELLWEIVSYLGTFRYFLEFVLATGQRQLKSLDQPSSHFFDQGELVKGYQG